MFGQTWERAEGTIVAKAVAMKWGLELAEGLQDYVVDVRPAGRPAFRTKVRGSVGPHFMDPFVGDIVPVLVDPKGEKAKFDTDDPTFSTLARANSQLGRLDEIAQQQPGSPISDPYGRPTVFNMGRDEGAAAERLGAVLSGATGPPGQTEDPAARIQKLTALLQAGLLTEDEYAAQRQRILNEI